MTETAFGKPDRGRGPPTARANNLPRDRPPDQPSNPPSLGGEEVFEALLLAPGVKLERIVSCGQATPAGGYSCVGSIQSACWKA